MARSATNCLACSAVSVVAVGKEYGLFLLLESDGMISCSVKESLTWFRFALATHVVLVTKSENSRVGTRSQDSEKVGRHQLRLLTAFAGDGLPTDDRLGSVVSCCPMSTQAPEASKDTANKLERKPYSKPTFRYERVFEISALACGKVQMGPTCAGQKKVS